jgi:AcrR family transcriptional regulator
MKSVSSASDPVLPWWPEERHGSLGLDKIATAAIDLIDEGGLGHLTMRRLADRLDTAPMTLYWYVDSRAELLMVVRDAAISPVLESLEDADGWQATLRSLATSMRNELVVAHPDLAPLVAGSEHAPGPNVLRLIDRVFAALLNDGFTAGQAAWAFRFVSDIALSFTDHVDVPGLVALVDQNITGYPSLTAVMQAFDDDADQTDQFSRTLEAAIRGIEESLGRNGRNR